jgi:RNA polymerase sigma-70 factor (ECF subfamily)
MAKELTREQVELLVIQAQDGDSASFARIYDFFVDPIYRYIYFKVPKADALDLTETVFLKVWENLRSYRSSQGSAFASWLYRIAHNAVVDHYRLHKEYAELDDNAADEKKDHDPVSTAERKLGQDALRTAISKLKKSYQQVILLKYINELENHEIAHVLGRSEGSLRILKFRALKALKKVLENMNITP